MTTEPTRFYQHGYEQFRIEDGASLELHVLQCRAYVTAVDPSPGLVIRGQLTWLIDSRGRCYELSPRGSE